MSWKIPILLFVCLLSVSLGACSIFLTGQRGDEGGEITGRFVKVTATAYCPCGACCGWKRNWRGQPVTKKGKPKVVGQTASGTTARLGTIAADTRYYPFGTIMYVPGYGYGRVEDTGGDIRGRSRLDLFYPDHRQAVRWGRQTLRVVVFPPGTPLIPHNPPPPQ
jgi:3D (Asp-Asp-Asp) domain-containing protein